MIEIKELSKSFGKKQIIKNLCFCFEKKTYGILGPNGAGKTTLLRCIAGLYKPDPKTIYYNKTDTNLSNKELKKSIGYLPQKFGLFYNLTVREALEFVSLLKKVENGNINQQVNTALEKVNLVAESDCVVKNLSGGMLRRLGIAQAILNNPDFIILDEPTNGLDPEERLRFKNIISELKYDHSIIISTHIVSDIETLCDEIIILDKGQIRFVGTSREISQLADEHCYLIDENEKDSIKGDYFIRQQKETDQGVMINIICRDLQDFQKTTPTTEDGYIWALKYMDT